MTTNPAAVSPLQGIAFLLEEEEFPFTLLRADEKRLVDILLVDVGVEGEPVPAELLFLGDLFAAAGEEDPNSHPVLQILARLNLELSDETLSGVSRLCGTLTEALGYGAISCSEETRVVFLRIFLHLSDRTVDGHVLGSVLSQAKMILAMGVPALREVGSGRWPYEKAVQSLIAKGFELPVMESLPVVDSSERFQPEYLS